MGADIDGGSIRGSLDHLGDVPTLREDDLHVDPRAERSPALTILCHPELNRVGERVRLPALTPGGSGVTLVSRTEPAFLSPRAPRSAERRALLHPTVSRSPLSIARRPDGDLVLSCTSDVVLDGAPLREPRVVAATALRTGVVIELGTRVAVLLHELGAVEPASSELGLVGESEMIEALRRSIERVADLEVPVLLRGETGTGKERVAHAIHATSGRRGPIVSVNTAALPAPLAVASLFGHVRGAFTGATADRRGHFQEAEGGTLFLDEIGEVPLEVQAMLLRALDHREVQPVGAGRPYQVDVRLIAATDSDLESAIARGDFREALLHRLSGYQIRVPPLRARPDDVCRLLVCFLREELTATHELDRLDGARPWLRASFVAALARHPWPGNVRQLRNIARQLAISSRGHAEAVVDDIVGGVLAGVAAPSEVRLASAPRAEPALTEARVLAALAQHDWRFAPAAAELGISRSRLYALSRDLEGVRTGRSLTRDDIAEALTGCDGRGELSAVAAALRVSRRALVLRMRELGIEPPDGTE